MSAIYIWWPRQATTKFLRIPLIFSWEYDKEGGFGILGFTVSTFF